MLGPEARKQVMKVTDPIARVLTKLGISANAMTVIGMFCSVAAALIFFPTGNLFVGTMFTWLFVMFDMLDGAIARQTGGGTVFGAVLDSLCDRIADGAVFAALAYWAAIKANNNWLFINLLILGILAQAISYIKARAEGSGITVNGGLVERTERLIIILVGSGFEGLGVPHALEIASVILLIGSVITLYQRLAIVAKASEKTKKLAEMSRTH